MSATFLLYFSTAINFSYRPWNATRASVREKLNIWLLYKIEINGDSTIFPNIRFCRKRAPCRPPKRMELTNISLPKYYSHNWWINWNIFNGRANFQLCARHFSFFQCSKAYITLKIKNITSTIFKFSQTNSKQNSFHV